MSFLSALVGILSAAGARVDRPGIPALIKLGAGLSAQLDSSGSVDIATLKVDGGAGGVLTGLTGVAPVHVSAGPTPQVSVDYLVADTPDADREFRTTSTGPEWFESAGNRKAGRRLILLTADTPTPVVARDFSVILVDGSAGGNVQLPDVTTGGETVPVVILWEVSGVAASVAHGADLLMGGASPTTLPGNAAWLLMGVAGAGYWLRWEAL